MSEASWRSPRTRERIFHHHAQHPIDLVVRTGKRAIGEGVEGLFGISAALENQAERFVPRSLCRGHHPLDARTDLVPDLVPYLRRRLAEGPGMLFAQRDASIRVVVEEGEFGSPGHPHGEARSDQDANRCLETVGPDGYIAQRSRCPVVGADQLAHERERRCVGQSIWLRRVFVHWVLSGFH